MVYLDANVFTAAAVAKDEMGDAARHILANLSKIDARTCCLTLDELAWAVMRRKDARTAANACKTALSLRDLHVVPVGYGDMWAMAREMEALGLRPRDALHLAVMKRLGEKSIVSEDIHFDEVGVKRIPIKTFAKSLG
jgi:predicted nucleic acid-binding protein